MSKYTYCTVVNRTPCDIKNSPILNNIFNSKGVSQPQSQAFFTFSQKKGKNSCEAQFSPLEVTETLLLTKVSRYYLG